mmetsp:Transcript_18944/g.22516  ORF Transcript_18944/g.22516 Transcript_18944/m.22516 type:complete len:276 (+) Transcript_18944:402-1229(+)
MGSTIPPLSLFPMLWLLSPPLSRPLVDVPFLWILSKSHSAPVTMLRLLTLSLLLNLLLLTMLVLIVLTHVPDMVHVLPMDVFAGATGEMAMRLEVLVINANAHTRLLGLIPQTAKTKLMLFVNVLDVVCVIDLLVTVCASLVTLEKDAVAPLAQMTAQDTELASSLLKCVMISGMTSNGLETCQPRINTTSNSVCCGMLTRPEVVYVILSTLALIAPSACVLRVTTPTTTNSRNALRPKLSLLPTCSLQELMVMMLMVTSTLICLMEMMLMASLL